MPIAHARSGCHTEPGRRPVNQDAVLAVRLADGRELVAVADGMGGHSAGEVASRRALEVVWKQVKAGCDLGTAVSLANAELYALAAENPAWRGMGTTLVAMLRWGTGYEVANIGDSRAYRVTAGGIEQITTDHSFVVEAMREARLATDDIVQSRWRNALTRALGTDEDVVVDMFGPFDVRERHAVLLCSDGLHRSVSDEVLQQHIAAATDPWAAAKALAAEAYRNGSSDNISVAVVLFGAETPRQRLESPVVIQRQRRGRRRRRSHQVRRTEFQLAVTVVLLIIVVMVLMRAL